MDIVTHAMMGAIVASPLVASQPLAAAAFMLGSALPDLDAVSRIFGKRAFLAAHQTFTHALPVIALLGGACWIVLAMAGIEAPWIAAALMLGMMFHSLLDATNTYGITLWAPFTLRRYCTEWIFFIDAVVISVTGVTLAWIAWRWRNAGPPGWMVPAVYVAGMAAYWIVRVMLRRRAMRFAPAGTIALIPSALTPWLFFGCAQRGTAIETFLITASGRMRDARTWPTYDDSWPQLQTLPEYLLMKRVSNAFHVVVVDRAGDRTKLTCKDLRTRNFGARFGDLEVVVNAAGAVVERRFHV
ncbi:MAG: metal-dependent hydrolase [Planctomycetes bacterium]|nr:metal-dependent hydrolase [Planctomycetota bacterium]